MVMHRKIVLATTPLVPPEEAFETAEEDWLVSTFRRSLDFQSQSAQLHPCA